MDAPSTIPSGMHVPQSCRRDAQLGGIKELDIFPTLFAWPYFTVDRSIEAYSVSFFFRLHGLLAIAMGCHVNAGPIFVQLA